MIEYLKNILPRVQRYSKQLDKAEVFIDKPWVFIDEESNHHEYMFLRDSRLIMSLNGKVREGKWELMPNGKLLVNRIDDSILLQNVFIDDALMFLKKSGTEDAPFILMNEQKVPDLDPLTYLEALEYKFASGGSSKNIFKVTRSGKLLGNAFYVGAQVHGYDQLPVSGVFQSDEYSNSTFFEIEQGVIKSIYKIIEVVFDGQSEPIKVKKYGLTGVLKKGDVLLSNPKSISLPGKVKFLALDGKWAVKVDSSGVVTNDAVGIWGSDAVLFISILGILILLILIFVTIS